MEIWRQPALAPLLAERRFTLVDIGATGGLQPPWSRLAPVLTVLAFDPDPRAQPGTDPGGAQYVWVPRAAAARAGRRTLHLAQKPETSSFLKPNLPLLARYPEARRFETERVVEVECVSLDQARQEHGLAGVDFIKLDTQGSELEILEGAAQTLPRVLGLEVEVEFLELYQGQPLFGQVDAAARAAGLELHDLKPYYWKLKEGESLGNPKGQIVFAEALYLRPVAGVLALAGGAGPEGLGVLARMLTLALLYGYCDYAQALLAASRDWWGPEAQAQIQAAITAAAGGARLAPRPWLARLATRLHRVWRRLAPEHRYWAFTASPLGNRSRRPLDQGGG